jgi:predicted RNA methylase
MPEKNPAAFFPTPEEVIDCMLDWGGVLPLDWDEYRVLEPSAGQGAIAERLSLMFSLSTVDVCELVGLNRQVLKAKGLNIAAHDFLTYQPEVEYDLIVMNPPFSVKGDRLAYITHISHAWEMLRGGGRLVSITPAGWTFGTESRLQEFRKLVCDFGQYDELERDAFKPSGTGVQAVVIWLEKTPDGQSWRRQPYQGCNSHHSWDVKMNLDSDFKWHKRYWEIVTKLAAGDYQMDLAGMPMGRAAQELKYLYRDVERFSNRDFGATIFLEDADIEFLLMEAAKEAMEVRSNE